MNTPPFKTSPALESAKGITHGFFSRHGGISEGIYASLNTGRGSDDTPEHIAENRKRVAKALGTDAQRLLSVHQCHTTDVITALDPWDAENNPKADAIVTNIPGIACSALSADCAPVLLADPVAHIVGAAHAGWRGALNGITDTTIEAMIALGAQPENIYAVIGPCIGPQHFEVGPEFVTAFIAEHQDTAKLFRKGRGDRSYFDIKTYLVRKLLRAGIHTAQALPDCTYEQNQDYFSYRYNTHNATTDYGRNISAIMIDL